MLLLFSLPRRIQHILDEDAVAGVGGVDQHMGDGADKPAVLDDGAAAHE